MVTTRAPQETTAVPAQEAQGADATFPLRLQLPTEWQLTDERFLTLAALNEAWRVESNAAGELIVMAPAGTESGRRELDIGAQLFSYCVSSGRGRAFGASSLFRLPNGWRRAPDAAWLSDERLSQIATADEGIWSVCPDFVVEVRSASDRFVLLQEKMEMWVAQGARLGWLVDPLAETVWLYRPSQAPERQARPELLTAAEIADDLTIDFSRIWPTRDPESETS